MQRKKPVNLISLLWEKMRYSNTCTIKLIRNLADTHRFLDSLDVGPGCLTGHCLPHLSILELGLLPHLSKEIAASAAF